MTLRSPLARSRPPADPDADLLARVRAGEERAFVELVARHRGTMLRLARMHVSSSAIAEEVVQDAWVAVLRGLAAFEGRSTFRTWLLQIVLNRARSTGVREHRTIAVGDAGPAVDPTRFDADGAWASPPRPWEDEIGERLDARALASQLRSGLDGLPARQREVVMLRDVDGLSSDEVCAALDITEANQRVLLHRGRSRLRAALEAEVGTP
ncbi:MAG TPA: sigma-70 family RNA polymerase sigma factor [Solirubrobacteraceae bacterium]|nr:sigma-70 family RNA polymerase sigma factor [Solirubrobacteraceae bacterium]